jgi:hypothetical protein
MQLSRTDHSVNPPVVTIPRDYNAAHDLLARNAQHPDKAAFIDAQKANYPIIWMCQMLNVSRSSIYAWRGHVDSAATSRRCDLATLITRAFADSRQTYGCGASAQC